MDDKKSKNRITLKMSKADFDLGIKNKKGAASTGEQSTFSPDFISMLEKVEEPDFPEYELRNSTAVLDGKEVSPEKLVQDYQRLKTEIRRLETISGALYKDVYKVETQYRDSIVVQRKVKQKQVSLIVSILTLVSLIIMSAIYWIKEQDKKVILQTVTQKEQEKIDIENKLAYERQQMDDKLKLIENNYKLQQDAFKSQFELEKQMALQSLQNKLDMGSLEDEEKNRLLQKLGNQLDQKYQKQLQNLANQLDKTKQQREKDLQKISSLVKQIENNKTGDNQSKELELIKRFEEQNKTIQKQLFEAKQKLEQLSEQNNAKLTGTNTEATNQNKNSFGNTNSNDEKNINLTSTTVNDGEFWMRKYYSQRIVPSESVEVEITTGSLQVTASFYVKNTDDNIRRELFAVSSPQSLKGFKYLSLINQTANDIQSWKYNPFEQRTTRTTINQRSESILNSEFTYEDWWPEFIDNYTYTYVQETNLRGRKTHIILAVPKTEIEKTTSQYQKKYYWIDDKALFASQIKFFTKDGKLSKIYGVKNLEKVENVWRPSSVFIINAQNRQKSYITFSNWQINKNTPDSLFSLQSFK